jgi:hypothetical protein
MGVVERVGNLPQQLDRPLQREGAVAAQELEQREPLQELHDQVVNVVVLVHVEDLDDVRVAQRSRDPAFGVEPIDDALVDLARQQHLDGPGDLERPVDTLVDGPHTALPELLVELVRTQAAPAQICHGALRPDAARPTRRVALPARPFGPDQRLPVIACRSMPANSADPRDGCARPQSGPVTRSATRMQFFVIPVNLRLTPQVLASQQ